MKVTSPAVKVYEPGGEGYEPGGEGYEPGGEGYEPGGEGYEPGGEGYEPGGEGYEPGGDFIHDDHEVQPSMHDGESHLDDDDLPEETIAESYIDFDGDGLNDTFAAISFSNDSWSVQTFKWVIPTLIPSPTLINRLWKYFWYDNDPRRFCSGRLWCLVTEQGGWFSRSI